MTDRELMQQALEALEYLDALQPSPDYYPEDYMQAREAITALRERLAQPEQEPVAHLWQHSETGRTRIVMPDQIVTADATWHVVGPLYLTPPRRWVGLTDDDLKPVCDEYRILFGGWVHDFARAIEAKLKEKNNG